MKEFKCIEKLLEKYNKYQLHEIIDGIKKGLDVSKYTDPKFNWEQMEEIRLGLKSGIDVTKYAIIMRNEIL